jgi:hypothetical protein
MPDHDMKHKSQLGWEELANGELLKMAEDNGYNLLITADQNRPYQNSVAGRLIESPGAQYQQLEPNEAACC